MKESDLQYLMCPDCEQDLQLKEVRERRGEVLETATVRCGGCDAEYSVSGGIPRFTPIDGYTEGFGLEWTRHARTQYDSYTGLRISEQRFFAETGWPRDLSGQLILEVGGGSGRFTEQAASTGAFVISIDSSSAVDANLQSNGGSRNVLIVQADVYRMPLRKGLFDKLFCFGVLQHTPDAHAAFLELPLMLKAGGEVVVDVYKKSLFRSYLTPKHLARVVTRRMAPDRLYRMTRKWVDFMWPVSMAIARVPRIGHSINWRLLVADHGAMGLDGALLKEWAYLDTFDMLSPRYDHPQTVSTLRRWFEEAGLVDVKVGSGHNGIEGRGRKPEVAGASPTTRESFGG